MKPIDLSEVNEDVVNLMVWGAATAQQARDLNIFVINYHGDIVETSLYDHVTQSVEKITSPRGIWPKLFFEKHQWLDHSDIDGDKLIEGFALKYWEHNGRARVVATYLTEEEAENDWFDRIYNFDFMEDDQRDTQFFATKEEAEQYIISLV